MIGQVANTIREILRISQLQSTPIPLLMLAELDDPSLFMQNGWLITPLPANIYAT